MKNFLNNFNWYQAVCVTLIVVAFIMFFSSIVLFMSYKNIAGCVCLAVMVACIFVVAGALD